ncbi:hypothetical protein ACFL0C_00940 [Patescibacteria group bacterium]
MNKLLQLLKVIFLLVGILVGLAILFVVYYFVWGQKDPVINATVKKTVVESVVDTNNMTTTQKEMLETGDIDGLVEDLKENVTQDQIDCAVGAVGLERAKQLMVTNDPSPTEMLKLSKCL